MADTCRDDLVELSDYAWHRLERRLAGLTDAEYLWTPVPTRPGDPVVFTTLAWRLCHIADFLREDRNGPWLGRPAPPPRASTGDPGTAAEALAALAEAYACWRDILDGTTESSLAAPIGALAGHYASSSRRSFVLHVLDELIHHGAEVALLRDLHAASRPDRT
jgi:DinB family protein